MTETNNDAVENMVEMVVRTKRIMKCLSLRNDDFQELINKMEEFTEKFCAHCFITDHIDINTERSEMVCYCEKCEKTVPIYPSISPPTSQSP